MRKNLTLIFLLALILRVLWIASMDNTVDLWQEEGVKEAAWSIIEGRGYEMPRDVSLWQDGDTPFRSWREPMFSFFLVPVFLLFGEHYLAAKLFFALFAAFMALMVYWLAMEMFRSRRVALCCALATAALPEIVYWSGHLAPETQAVFMFVPPVLFLLRALRVPCRLNLVMAGVFLGLAALTRAQMIILTPLLLLAWLAARGGGRRGVREAVLIAFSFLVVFSPWVIRNYLHHGQLVIMPTVTGEVLYIANNPGTLETISEPGGIHHGEDPSWFEGLTEIQIHNWYRGRAFDFIINRPRDYITLVADRFGRFWRFFPHMGAGFHGHTYGIAHLLVGLLTSGTAILLFLAGSFFALKDGKWRAAVIPLTLVACFSLLTILGRAAVRYRLPIMPFVLIFAVYGAWRFFGADEKEGAHVEG